MREKFIAVVVAAIFCVALAGSAVAEEINAYMGTSPDNNAKIAQFIKDKTGITVNQTFQSFGEIEARVKAEAPNFNADMIIGCGSSTGFMAKKNGWAVPYASPAWKGVADVFMDPQGNWYNIGNFSFVLVGNKDRLAKAGLAMPKSWKELLDPKWKGEIVMPSPVTSGTAFMINATFLQLYGWEKGWDFLEKLDKNVAQYTRSGNAPLEHVGRGEYILGLTSDEKVPQRLQQGFPILWTAPKEGLGYEGNIVAIVKGTKQLAASKKIVDFAGTEKFQRWLAQFGYLTARDAPNAMYPSKPKLVEYSYEWAADNHARIIDTWKTKFLRK